jgi:hypothetical protein
MSNEGFRNVPGVPDGWELVAIRPAMPADWFVNRDGKAEQWRMSWKSKLIHAIIRKIEQPAKYRQFANAEEFLPHADRKISRVGNDGKKVPGFTTATSCSDSGVWLGDIYSDWKEMLDRGHVFLDDGTPFGVKVDER